MPMGVYPRATVTERFWAHADRTASEGCWLWDGKPNSSGYGVYKVDGKMQKAHRIAWQWAFGRIPVGLYVCHRCDVRLCVRPGHLFLSTNEGNTRDRATKGRTARQNGEANGMAKISGTTANAIRARAIAGTRHRDLAQEYGVSTSLVSMIATGRRWRDVRVVKEDA